jgi:hypothetical protein
MKKCNKCLENKEFNEFYKHSGYKDGYRNSCVSCCKLERKLYRQTNKVKINNYNKSIQIKRNIYNLKYRNNNINAKLAHMLRCRVSKILINQQKQGSAVTDLGCSLDEFKIYLESKFVDGMTWNNYGLKGWHLDHIIPLASFDLCNIDEFKKAVHYTNLQPLWCVDNLKKGSRTNAENY